MLKVTCPPFKNLYVSKHQPNAAAKVLLLFETAKQNRKKMRFANSELAKIRKKMHFPVKLFGNLEKKQ